MPRSPEALCSTAWACRELPPHLTCMEQLRTLKVHALDWETPAIRINRLRLSSRQLPALLRKLPHLTWLEITGLVESLRPGLERAAAKMPQLQLQIETAFADSCVD